MTQLWGPDGDGRSSWANVGSEQVQDPVSSVFAAITIQLSRRATHQALPSVQARLCDDCAAGRRPPWLLWQPPAAPDMDTLSSTDSSQLWTKAPSKTREQERHHGSREKGPRVPQKGHEAITGQESWDTRCHYGCRSWCPLPWSPVQSGQACLPSPGKPAPVERRLVHGDRHLISLLSDALPRGEGSGGWNLYPVHINIYPWANSLLRNTHRQDNHIWGMWQMSKWKQM